MIVIVDDDPTSLRLLSMLLRREGLKHAAFSDPTEALAHIRSTGGIQLIISDIRMPQMGGLEFVAAARQLDNARYAPIVLCTSVNDVDTVRAAASRGVRDYILKPIDPTTVTRKIRTILNDVGSVMATPGELKNRLGIETREYVELARATLPNLDRLVTEAETAIGADDAAGLALVAERIGEPARIFGANRCLAIVDQLMTRFDDESAVIEAGRVLIRETALFRATLERASAKSAGSWYQG